MPVVLHVAEDLEGVREAEEEGVQEGVALSDWLGPNQGLPGKMKELHVLNGKQIPGIW